MTLDHIDRTVQCKLKANFRTSELVFRERGIATFVRSRALKRFLAAVIVFCSLMTAGVPWFLLYSGFFEAFGKGPVLFVVASDVITTAIMITAIVLYFRFRPLVFDKRQGRLWRQGRPDPVIGDYALLKDVEAVQVCSAMVSGNEGSKAYPVYELNIVMKRPAGQRVSTICHGNRAAMFDDARKLGEFLDAPVLDHTEEPFAGISGGRIDPGGGGR